MDNALKLAKEPKKPWYKDGLRFECTGCGKCCTGGPGAVWVTDTEIQEISTFLNLSQEEVVKKYTRKLDSRRSLIEIPNKSNKQEFDCIFLENKKCSIYSVRPKQCRTFPWWISNLKSPEDWKRAAKDCEGISDCAPIVPYDQIVKSL